MSEQVLSFALDVADRVLVIENGEIVRDEQDVNLNPATPPGTYRLAVRVPAPDGAFLTLADGLDYLLLPDEITIVP